MQALGFSLAARLSAAFQGPKKTLTDIASLSVAPFSVNSNRALGMLISLLLITGTLVFLLRKRTAAIINKFIAWIIRTEVAAKFVVTALSLRSGWLTGIQPSFDPTAGFLHLEAPLCYIHRLDCRPRSSFLHSLVARCSSRASYPGPIALPLQSTGMRAVSERIPRARLLRIIP
ncbi:hypothetical protein C8R44DRAFT_988338 [Mycena epipterygia]|nr:hypothetical protein C8R44DRAFT_988338 [Mycena epipterygia]